MGTNYYIEIDSELKLETVNYESFELYPEVDFKHIGKASCNWRFALHYCRPHGLGSWHQWRNFIFKQSAKGLRIVNEYSEELTYQELFTIMIDRNGNGKIESKEFYEKNMCKYDFNHNGLFMRDISKHKYGIYAAVYNERDVPIDLVEGDFC